MRNWDWASVRNWDRVSEGFDILHPALVDFVVRNLIEAYGIDGWWDKGVEPILTDDQRRSFKGRATDRERISNNLDIALTLHTIDCNWTQVFCYELPRECHSWVTELQEMRNYFVHKGVADCSSDDAYRYLDTMRRLCAEVDDDPSAARAGKIRSLMDEVLPDLVAASEERKVSAAAAAASSNAAGADTTTRRSSTTRGSAAQTSTAANPAPTVASGAKRKTATSTASRTARSASKAAPRPADASKADDSAPQAGAAKQAAASTKAANSASQAAAASKKAAPDTKAAKTTTSAKRAASSKAASAKTTSSAKQTVPSKAARTKSAQGSTAKAATSAKGARSTKNDAKATRSATSSSAPKAAATPAGTGKPMVFAAYSPADVNHNYSSSAEPNVEFVRDVLSIEAPVHRDVVIRRMGQRLRRPVADRDVKHEANAALNKLLAEPGTYRRDGDFIYPANEAAGAKPRSAGDRTWEEIPPKELEAGLLLVLTNEQSSGSQGLSRTRLINRTFSEFMPDAENARATGEAYKVLVATVDSLESAGKVNIADDATRTVSLSAQEKQAAGKSQTAAATSKPAAAKKEPASTASEETRVSSAAKGGGSVANSAETRGSLPGSLACHAKNSASGVEAQGTFHYPECTLDVLLGSQIDLRKTPNSRKVNELRRELIESGALEEQSDGIYVLKQTVSFDTPSAAGTFVLGSSGGGWDRWKGPDGRSLGTIYPKEARPKPGGNFKVSATPQASDESSQIAERSKGARAASTAQASRVKSASKDRAKKTQPTTAAQSASASASSGASKDATVKVYAYIPGCDKRATAVFNRSNGQTDVLEGSFVRIAPFDSLPHHIKEQREKLLASGDLVARDGRVYVLKKPVSFDSATAAAEFVLGRSASGATDWKDAQSGKTLGEVYPELFPRRKST